MTVSNRLFDTSFLYLLLFVKLFVVLFFRAKYFGLNLLLNCGKHKIMIIRAYFGYNACHLGFSTCTYTISENPFLYSYMVRPRTFNFDVRIKAFVNSCTIDRFTNPIIIKTLISEDFRQLTDKHNMSTCILKHMFPDKNLL